MWHLKKMPELVRDGKHWTPVDTWMVVGEDDGTTRTQCTRDAPKNDRGGSEADGARHQQSRDALAVRAVQLDQRTLEVIVTGVAKRLLEARGPRGTSEPGTEEAGTEGTSTAPGTFPKRA